MHYENGKYLVDGAGEVQPGRWVEELRITATRRTGGAGASVRSRVALYKPWRANMDEGWTRWLLDQYEFKYVTITNTDFHAGELASRFDVVVLASDGAETLLNGYPKGFVPPRYEGGIGAAGVRALDQFVRAGGTLVCLNESSNFAIEQLHLPVKNVVADLDRKRFFASGSILEVAVDTTHPVMAGMPDRARVFFDDSPVFATTAGFDGVALAKYQADGSPLVSGYLLGEKQIQSHAAALDVRLGKGHVILIGFRPQWRGQPFGTFRVLFNAALFAGPVSAQATGAKGFWTSPPVKADSGSAKANAGTTSSPPSSQ